MPSKQQRYYTAGVNVTDTIHATVDRAGEPSDETKVRLRAILRSTTQAVLAEKHRDSQGRDVNPAG